MLIFSFCKKNPCGDNAIIFQLQVAREEKGKEKGQISLQRQASQETQEGEVSVNQDCHGGQVLMCCNLKVTREAKIDIKIQVQGKQAKE